MQRRLGGTLRDVAEMSERYRRCLLAGVTGASERGVTDQVLNAEDGCGLILAQGSTPAEDAACVLFPGQG